MKRMLLLSIAAFFGLAINAQLLTWTPPFPKEDDPSQTLVITVDATKGNQGLLNYTPTSDVYVHTGVITSSSTGPTNWKYVKFNQNFNQPNPQLQASYIGNNKWQFTITGSLKTYYGVPANETILKIAILFRNGAGTKKQATTDNTNSDMYIPVYGNALAVRIDQPPLQPKYIPVPEPLNWTVGSNFSITAVASNPSAMKLYHNGNVIASATNVQTLSGNSSVAAVGNQQLVAEANDGTTTKFDTLNIFVSPATSPTAALPSGVKDGINYEQGDTSVVLVLRAPGKNKATVIGDFNNWVQNTNYIMNKTPDGKFFWLRIHPLTAGSEYGYQYLVDDTVKIADPYTEKILDPNNDKDIAAATYPNLKSYPAGQSGIISVLQTAPPAYNWTVNNFSRPDKRGLVIYELLVRDFVAAHDWKTITDSLNYLKNLGVNAIEVMPFNEFENNNSWGYNPDFYFAPDKYYGTKNALKTFIDSCHKKGIAVIMDIVLNHTYGPSPLKLLYSNPNGGPASNNPWYNTAAPHAFGFGDDFNHESADTKYFFNRVLQHWITEYKIDGYRFDFSKGLTQKPSSNDGTFSAYDASRIAIINGYYNAIKTVDPNSYLILEHFCDNTEEKELSDNGMMLWANVWTQYQEASMGFSTNSNLDWGVYTARGWTNPHLVTFMESHDEERVTYKNIKYGNVSGNYNIKDTTTALKRMELNAAFLFTIPGPKMIWQFGELGYDYSRCYLSSNGDESGNCDKKLDPKPIRWDYLNDNRRKSVYNTYSNLIRLRFHPSYKNAFLSGTIERSLNSSVKWIKVSSGDTSHMLVVGNFDVTPQTASVTFQTAGTWYDYLNNTTFAATVASQSIPLQPGEFRVYVNKNVNNLATTPVINVPWNGNDLDAKVYPNPVSSDFTLELNLPQTSGVHAQLYSTLGQPITIMYDGTLVKGTHQVPLKRRSVAKGIYYLKITTKTATKTIQVTFQ
jgi:1,4-alpha-glucan branching enzyme